MPLPRLDREPFEHPRQQILPVAHGNQPIVGSDRSGSVPIVGRSILGTVEQHQPPKTPPARPPHTADMLHGKFVGGQVFDANHPVTGYQRFKESTPERRIGHDDDFRTDVLGREQVLDLREPPHAAAKERETDGPGSVAGGAEHTRSQQPLVTRPQEGQNQPAGPGDGGQRHETNNRRNHTRHRL